MKAFKKVFIIAVSVFALVAYIDFARHPESYITTWRYQLENDIKNGDEKAIEYYNRVYVATGRELFE